jgi:hypothetical protein
MPHMARQRTRRVGGDRDGAPDNGDGHPATVALSGGHTDRRATLQGTL